MARSWNVKVEGLKEIDAALAQFPKATGRNVMRRVAVKRLEPMAEDARRRAPVLEQGGGDLRDSIAVSTKAAGYAKRINRGSKSEVEAYMGPGGVGGKKAPPQGTQQEFGNQNHGPQPFMRPAWDAGKHDLLGGIADDLWAEIDKAAKRAARKAARLAAKGG
ncbi:MAG: HK97 gp10 family phage protein [Brevundimonas sp.]|nr:MAG: HK97 gp10 family phage protein [Brevundimonas sp.]